MTSADGEANIAMSQPLYNFELGRIAYEAYVADCDGKSIHGEDLPAWDDQAEQIREHWSIAALAVADAVA